MAEINIEKMIQNVAEKVIQGLRELLDNLQEHFIKKGLPINIRKGNNEEVANYILKVVESCIHEDEPLGTIPGMGYDHCPRCNAIIGQSAYYCKTCGAWIREGGK
jgi:hypothetical protein